MIEQKKQSILTEEEFVKVADIKRDGAVLKVEWVGRSSEPDYEILIGMNPDRTWRVVVIAGSESSSSQENFTTQQLADAFYSSIAFVVENINALWKKEYEQSLRDTTAAQEIDAFIKGLPSRWE